MPEDTGQLPGNALVTDPALNGRLQTGVGALAAGARRLPTVTPLLPVNTPLGDTYGVSHVVLVTLRALGVGWKIAWRAVLQPRFAEGLRALFALVAALSRALRRASESVPQLPRDVPLGAFLLPFATTWIVTWLVDGPFLRVPVVHWRFREGRLI